jgi:hypothetical protein
VHVRERVYVHFHVDENVLVDALVHAHEAATF